MAGPASAQPPDPDSVRALRAARSAQSDFEFLRRRSLPTVAGSPGPCQEMVGRLCYWYDEGGKLPEEPAVIRRGRARLLTELAAAARERPADDWILGQWVRYLVEQKEADSAVAAATNCRGTPWWCGALEGFALHTGERFAEASQAFERSLARMPAGQACRWLDLTKLLEDDLASGYRATPCEARIGLTDTLLWLSQPLLSREGNDLRTELLARRVMITLLGDAAQWTHEMAWASDAAEILLRYGWEVGFGQRERPYPTQEPGKVVGYERFPAYAFLPRRVSGDSGESSWRWNLHPELYRTALP